MATIDDWFDEATLLGIVPADVFMRGASAVEAGAVVVLERSDARLLTTVEAGDGVVRAEWALAGDQLQFACGCGHAVAQPCEHLIASALWTWPDERPDEDD
ncbi:MAG TPA: hypothetical protein VMH50_08315 [Thermoleophilia bacterium]|nr:hypothetical protein [Thermoleophilia bacterium]